MRIILTIRKILSSKKFSERILFNILILVMAIKVKIMVKYFSQLKKHSLYSNHIIVSSCYWLVLVFFYGYLYVIYHTSPISNCLHEFNKQFDRSSFLQKIFGKAYLNWVDDASNYARLTYYS